MHRSIIANTLFSFAELKSVTRLTVAAAALVFGLTELPAANADVVTDWNATLGTAIKTAATGAAAQGRQEAVMHAAIYDAVNGIVRKYNPFHVTESAPGGARPEAAAAQAAYTAAVSLYPAQKTLFDAQLAASLAAIPGAPGNSQSIATGRAWGEKVARNIVEWRGHDGFGAIAPYYFGGNAPGQWRPVPPNGTLPAVFPDIAVMTPFAMIDHAQFRSGPPPALDSPEYAASVNEVKALGRVDSVLRTPEQTQLARLWHAVDVVDECTAVRGVVSPKMQLVDNARLFALLTITAADALIAGMDTKYTYNLWRPYHAIRLADTDGNPDTVADPDWTPLLVTPRHQEYISNHGVFTGSFMRILTNFFGDNNAITISSPGFPGFNKTYPSFSAAGDEVGNARIWGGIHYRFSTTKGIEVGRQIADYVTANFLLPANH